MTTVSSTSSASTAASSSSSSTVLTADQLLAKVKGTDTSSSANGVLSSSDLLQIAYDKAHNIPVPDSLQVSPQAAALSPVDKLMQAAAAAKTVATTNDYTTQPWYLKAKVAQLQSQLAIYTSMPSLDPSGTIVDSIQSQATKIQQQEATLAKQQTDAQAAAAKQAATAAAATDKTTSATDLLAKVQGGTAAPALSAAASALLAKAQQQASGGTVNTTA